MPEQINNDLWVTIESPGYFGSKREELELRLDAQYGFDENGERNWRVSWESANGDILTFDEIFQEYIAGYAKHLNDNPEVLYSLVNDASFIYDIDDSITKEQAFDPYFLFNKLGVPNQFHNVAINIAIERILGIPFTGRRPLQVRGTSKSVPIEQWSKVQMLQPGFIPCLHPELIRKPEQPIWWIREDSIEGLYQYNKVIQVRKI